MAYVDTALKAEDLALQAGVCVALGHLKIGLFRGNDGFFAIDNACPHKGAPMCDGFVHDGTVTCPWHQWNFRLSDGVCLTVPQVRIGSYPVEVRDGNIWINPETQEAP